MLLVERAFAIIYSYFILASFLDIVSCAVNCDVAATGTHCSSISDENKYNALNRSRNSNEIYKWTPVPWLIESWISIPRSGTALSTARLRT